MSDTIGSLIDKLITVDMKLWDAQGIVYEIRKMSLEEFKAKYYKDEEGFVKFYEYLNKATNLNLQRNNIIDELDDKLLDMLKEAQNGSDLDLKGYVQKKMKVY
jgi:hypothetical protein